VGGPAELAAGWMDERMNGIDQFQHQQRNAACAIIYLV
jgi:hypothetical protein